MALKLSLIELLVIKRTEFLCQTPKSPYQLEIRRDDISRESDPRFLCKLNTFFSLSLRLGQGVSDDQKIHDNLRQAVCRVCKVPSLVSDVECVTYQLSGLAKMPRHGNYNASETHTCASLKPLQSALLEQVVAELTKSNCVFVFTESRCGYHCKPHISKGRCVGVAVLETKIHEPENNECAQIVVKEHGRRNKFRQDLKDIQGIGIGYQGLIHEILYLPVPKQ